MNPASGLIHETTRYWIPPIQVAEQVKRTGSGPWIFLHSLGSHPCGARYSFLAAHPKLTFESRASRISITYPETGQCVALYGNPWRAMESLWDRFEQKDDSPWPTGALMGYWGYDLKHFSAPKSTRSAWRDLDVPDSWIGLFSSLAVFDQETREIHLIASGINASGERNPNQAKTEIAWWRELLDQAGNATQAKATPCSPPPTTPLQTRSNLNRSAWIQRIQQARDYIRAGDIYQLNLSHRIHTRSQWDPWEFTQKLFQISPAPYSGFLDTGNLQLGSSSPELFLVTDGRRIRSTPIKGTRPRGATPVEDKRLEDELTHSEKERAELVMITDLIRNDLGRISEYGSIQTPDLLRLEKYAQVQHLVSTIEGQLRADIHPLKALEYCFPGGSITGAPKIRAMEIIEELEPIGRGPYTGSLGYLGLNGHSAWNILIRTALFHQGQVHFNTGAGIVYDSDPEMEYEETLGKASGFLKTLTAMQSAAPTKNSKPANFAS